MLIASDGHGDAVFGKRLNFVFLCGGNRNAVLLQLVDDDLYDFMDVLQRFLAGAPRGGGAVLLKGQLACLR